MRTTLTFTLILLLCTISSTSCAQQRKATDQFEVTGFTAIKSSVVANIMIMQSDKTSVTAEGSEELLNILEVKIDDGKLILEMEKSFWKQFNKKADKLLISISTPTLTKIDFDGVGNINIKGSFSSPGLIVNSKGVGNFTARELDGGHVHISSEGVGNISIAGTADSVEIRSEGVGNIDAGELKSRRATVYSQGVGNVSCFASEFLKARSGGIGNITYYGKPMKTDLSKDGIGKIRAGN